MLCVLLKRLNSSLTYDMSRQRQEVHTLSEWKTDTHTHMHAQNAGSSYFVRVEKVSVSTVEDVELWVSQRWVLAPAAVHTTQQATPTAHTHTQRQINMQHPRCED